MGADADAIPFAVLERLFDHPLTAHYIARQLGIDDEGGRIVTGPELARMDERALADIFWRYGEEKASRRIARAIVTDRAAAPFTSRATLGQVLQIPIKHGEGRYHVTPEELARLEAANQVVLRYCTPDGDVTDAANPNGSVGNVAAVCNAAGNVMGLMPHPEHAVEALTGSTDGRVILGSLLDSVGSGR